MKSELIKLDEDGQLDRSVKYIKKASSKVIKKLHRKHEYKRLQKANEFITDMLISTFSKLLGGLHAVESPEVMKDELKKDEVLRRDVTNLVSSLTPYVPYLDFLSGGITVGKHWSPLETKYKLAYAGRRATRSNKVYFKLCPSYQLKRKADKT